MGDSDRGDIKILWDHCKGCGLCVEACPAKVLVLGGSLNRQGYFAVTYNGSGCTGCGICFYVCPEPDAIIVLVKKKEDKPAA